MSIKVANGFSQPTESKRFAGDHPVASRRSLMRFERAGFTRRRVSSTTSIARALHGVWVACSCSNLLKAQAPHRTSFHVRLVSTQTAFQTTDPVVCLCLPPLPYKGRATPMWILNVGPASRFDFQGPSGCRRFREGAGTCAGSTPGCPESHAARFRGRRNWPYPPARPGRQR